jgi:glyceraldehyde-3-phosphate dehydrogenase/erythrose-4-phosphate dehydrogenase
MRSHDAAKHNAVLATFDRKVTTEAVRLPNANVQLIR